MASKMGLINAVNPNNGISKYKLQVPWVMVKKLIQKNKWAKRLVSDHLVLANYNNA